MKEFIFYHRDERVPRIATTPFFCEENGFSVDDICEVVSLEIGETIIVGMDEAIITRIWNAE